MNEKELDEKIESNLWDAFNNFICCVLDNQHKEILISCMYSAKNEISKLVNAAILADREARKMDVENVAKTISMNHCPDYGSDPSDFMNTARAIVTAFNAPEKAIPSVEEIAKTLCSRCHHALYCRSSLSIKPCAEITADAKAIHALIGGKGEEICMWKEEAIWWVNCKGAYRYGDEDDSNEKRILSFKFCPDCGRKIKVVG